jgi:ABC-type multidrug transport system ATPase subunit
MMTDTSARGDAPVPERPAAIEIEDLVVSYGRRRAVDGLSMRVPVGSVYGYLGPNGAGKTTTIKTLLGFRRPDGGVRECSATTSWGRAWKLGHG